MESSHHDKKFIERVLTDDIDGEYDNDGFFVTPNGSYWDPDGVYFNREGFDRHGGYYEDNGEYIPGKGWDNINNCYYDEHDDFYEDEDEDDGYYAHMNDDDDLDEEIPITGDIEKIHITSEEIEAIAGKPITKKDNNNIKENNEQNSKKEKNEPVKKSGLASLFP